eukprot:scaffold36396_cov63-Phaeocystis_antarctica.AAC.2
MGAVHVRTPSAQDSPRLQSPRAGWRGTQDLSFRSFIHYKAYRGPKAALPTSDPTNRSNREALVTRVRVCTVCETSHIHRVGVW